MRLLLFASLVVAVLGGGLWWLIVRDEPAPVAADTQVPRGSAMAEPAAPAAAPGEIQARRAENVGAELRKTIAAQRPSTDDRAAPSLSPSGESDGSGSAKKPATEADRVRWAMMRAVRSLEPGIIECMDAGRKAGETFATSIAAYGYTIAKTGDTFTVEQGTLEYGPFSEATNDCIRNAGKTMAVERLPPGASRVRVFAKLTLENGEIKNLQMPSYEVVETEAAPQ